jgi:hypothetical protein
VEGRVRFGIETLDKMLGGGLLPGTLTVVYGATGIGKTHCTGGAPAAPRSPNTPSPTEASSFSRTDHSSSVSEDKVQI